jgi:hypothetical protein
LTGVSRVLRLIASERYGTLAILNLKPIKKNQNGRRGVEMAEPTKSSMVYVYDKEGNAYICDLEDLRDAKTVSDEEKAGCTDLDRGGFSRNE